MKKRFFILTLSFTFLPFLYSQNLTIHNHEGVELLSTLWVLANGSTDTASQHEVERRFGSLRNQKAVTMLEFQNRELTFFEPNFEEVVLPYLGMKLRFEKHRSITFDTTRAINNRTLSRWNSAAMDEFVKALNEFYTTSDFHTYYLSRDNRTVIQNRYPLKPLINLERINQIMGTSIQNVDFIAPIILPKPTFCVPFVFVDDELLLMFVDADSEMEYPSQFTLFNHGNQPSNVLGLFTALYVREEQKVSTSTPGFTNALATLLYSHRNKSYSKGLRMWNVMSKWVPLLLVNEYYSDNAPLQQEFIDQAEEMGFI